MRSESEIGFIAPGPTLRVRVKYEGMGEDQKKVIRALGQGAVVKFSFGPDPRASRQANLPDGLTIWYGGARLLKIEKAKD